MSYIGGYQSDVNAAALRYVGDFPLDHSLGGYGIASGTNTYTVTLSPAISAYRTGMLLAISFVNNNTGPATINVNGKGAKPIQKVLAGSLAALEAGDLANDKLYLLAYDGNNFQLANSGHILFDASEQRKGIAQIASQAEVDAGTNNSKFITPAKLLAYITAKITGLWNDQGTIDCIANPTYPVAQKGYAYVVSAAGKIGGPNGVNVQVRDVIYCAASNPGGAQEQVGQHWNIVQANLEQATEVLAGFARLATQQEALDGTSTTTIITPATLRAVVQSLSGGGGGGSVSSASETVAGILELATESEVSAGTDGLRAVTPLRLAAYIAEKISGLWKNRGTLDCSGNPDYPAAAAGHAYTVLVAGKIGGINGLAVEARDLVYCIADSAPGSQAAVGDHWNIVQGKLVQATDLAAGIARFATQAEVTTGTNTTTMITPALLRFAFNTAFGSYSPPAGTEATAGIVEIATQAEVDAETDNQRAVTAQKLAAYVAGKITGLWKNKGLLDCSAFPDYPAGLVGDAYTVSVAGRIGGALGTVVDVRDVIYCIANNAGGSQAAVGANWGIVQANLVQATELLAGYAKIATQADLTTGTDDTKFITPLKLKTLLDTRIKKMRTQIKFCSASLAEQELANTGMTGDAQAAIINVIGLPATITIHQATLSWEGTVRQSDNGFGENELEAGFLTLASHNQPPTNFLSLVGKVKRSPGASFYRFVEDDVTIIGIANGQYDVKLRDMRSTYEGMFLSGTWTLELDYEAA